MSVAVRQKLTQVAKGNVCLNKQIACLDKSLET